MVLCACNLCTVAAITVWHCLYRLHVLEYVAGLAETRIQNFPKIDCASSLSLPKAHSSHTTSITNLGTSGDFITVASLPAYDGSRGVSCSPGCCRAAVMKNLLRIPTRE